MINSFDCVHENKAILILLSTEVSHLKFGEDLRMTKADNGQAFLTNLGVRKSVDQDSRLGNIR